jgi:hypothetical protein
LDACPEPPEDLEMARYEIPFVDDKDEQTDDDVFNPDRPVRFAEVPPCSLSLRLKRL